MTVKKDFDEYMDKKVQVMMYQDDYEQVEMAARKLGISVSALFRLSVMKYIGDVK